jgi:hypothetical protein
VFRLWYFRVELLLQLLKAREGHKRRSPGRTEIVFRLILECVRGIVRCNWRIRNFATGGTVVVYRVVLRDTLKGESAIRGQALSPGWFNSHNQACANSRECKPDHWSLLAASLHTILSLPCEAKKKQNFDRVKSWEIIADNLSKAGCSWGCVLVVDSNGRTAWIADAHRGDGKRFVAHADEKLTISG